MLSTSYLMLRRPLIGRSNATPVASEGYGRARLEARTAYVQSQPALGAEERRGFMSGSLRFNADALLLDIEALISPLSFVRDILFSYSREHLADFVAGHRATPAVDAILEVAALAVDTDPIAALIGWQERDEKVPPLKKLQGLIWESGYRNGAFQSYLFPDALAALKRWKASGLPLYVYSSGSLKAQELFSI